MSNKIIYTHKRSHTSIGHRDAVTMELTLGFMWGGTSILEGGGSKLENGCRTRVVVWWQEERTDGGVGGQWEKWFWEIGKDIRTPARTRTSLTAELGQTCEFIQSKEKNTVRSATQATWLECHNVKFLAGCKAGCEEQKTRDLDTVYVHWRATESQRLIRTGNSITTKANSSGNEEDLCPFLNIQTYIHLHTHLYTHMSVQVKIHPGLWLVLVKYNSSAASIINWKTIKRKKPATYFTNFATWRTMLGSPQMAHFLQVHFFHMGNRFCCPVGRGGILSKICSCPFYFSTTKIIFMRGEHF